MPSVAPLPFARRPYQDELLSSWLKRLACVYDASWETLYAAVNAQNLPPVGDYGGTGRQFRFLSELTRIPAEEIKRLDLARRFPGQPVQRFLCHPATRLAVPDFCPACWKDDLENGRDCYFRIDWAIAGVSHCQVHRRLLRSHCPHCFTHFIPLASASGDAMRILCADCHAPVSGPHQENYRRSDDGQSSQKLRDTEAGILRSLHGEHGGLDAPFGVYEDLAFLFFANWLPASAACIKPALGRWRKSTVARVTSAMRESRLLPDPSLIFPLATTEPTHRAALLRAAIAVVSEERDILVNGPRRMEIRACLVDLFLQLADPAREEMVFRANTWPTHLRKEVRRIIDQPGTYHTQWYEDREMGWAASKVRRDVNNGKIPVYGRL